MENLATTNFILIDDDVLNNMVCRKVIRNMVPQAQIQAFTDPEKGVEHMQLSVMSPTGGNTVLFLDINMPSLTGWDVLEKFHAFEKAFDKRVKVYMLSSSINPVDKERAARNKLVTGYISKPLSGNILHTIIPGLA